MTATSDPMTKPDAATAPPQKTVFWKCVESVARLLTTLLFDFKTWNSRSIPPAGGVLLVTNHQSYLDPVLVAVKLRRPMSFLAKSELFENPAFAWFIRRLNAFPVRQGKGDVGAMKESIRLLQEGHVLNIFPEGSRSEDGELQPVAGGVALVIKRAKVPVLPVALEGSYACWPKHRPLFRAGKIRLVYGEPLILHDKDSREILSIIDSEFKRLFAEARKKMKV
jgi:1-acyl-sn-glycerol-3-phosphate acyltransferase